ncbi:MAG: glycosyltransferase family 39 protein [Planctomycetes bacterium]|nr:glycosyltransferase family 39 protein [Planctomycetota bacterium]
MSAAAWALSSGLAAVLLVLAKCAPRIGGRAARWFGLAALSFAALLWLYDAGPRVTYQHVFLAERFERAPLATSLALGVLALEFVCVVVACVRRMRELAAWIERRLGFVGALFVVVASLASAAKLRQPAFDSALEFVLVGAVHAATFGAVLLGAWALSSDGLDGVRVRADAWFGPERDGAGSARQRDEPEPGRLDGFACLLALASVAVAALLAFFVYERHPHVPDEVVYLLHARYLATGVLSVPAPPVPEAFDVDLMLLEDGRWYSPVNPGWPFALAPAAPLGAEWLVNPVLGGVAILLAYALLREVTSLRNARIATALLACSPWFVFLDMSFMTHTWTLVCALAGALGVARAGRTGKSAWAWFGGAGVGMVATIRPLEGLVLALCLGVWALGFGGKRLKFGALAGLVLGTAVVAACVLPYNAALTGSAKVFPINHYVDTVYGPGKNDLGFGPDKGLDWGGLDPWPGHTPFQALVNAQFNTFAIDVELFGWACGSLVLVWLALALRPWTRFERACVVFVLAIVGSNSLYWFAGGPDFGARYWQLVIVPLVVLAVGGLTRLGEDAEQRARWLAAAGALSLGALLLFVPWRALDKYRDYRGMTPGARELAERVDFGRSLVLVRGKRHPDYASAAILNPLDFEADAPIYAWDKNPEVRAQLLAHYADRPVWVIAGPSETGRDFEVLEGPLAPGVAPNTPAR